MLSFLFVILVFGAALATRLRHRRWELWLVWIILSLIGFFGNLFNGISIEQSGFEIMLVSLFGFLGPEIWQGIRQATVNFLSQPRNWLYIFGIGILIYGFLRPEILANIVALGIVFFAIKFMLSPLFSQKRRRR
jgi:hypothetical protein